MMGLPGGLVAWSHSRVKMLRTCARQFAEIHVLKRIKDAPKGFEQNTGLEIHKVLEQRIKTRKELPPQYQYLEPVAQVIEEALGDTYCEVQLGLDANLEPCGYKDWDRCWVRAIVDILKVGIDTLLAGDYKTGKVDVDEAQLKLTAAMLFKLFPRVNTITTSYIWLAFGTVDSRTYTRDQLDDLWEELLEDPRKMVEFNILQRWPTRPGHHCAWCPVNKAGLCEDARKPYKGN